jgi:thiamine-phosphate pyrophosphorylase
MSSDPIRRAREALLASVDLYLVTSEELSDGRSDLDILRAGLAGGVRMVQLRDKRSKGRAFFEKARAARRICEASGALLIINDHLDVAMAVDADGVHLGTDDLPVDVARSLAPSMVIGASSHSLGEALAAQKAGASYVNIGPVYQTATKPDAPRFLGPEAVTAISRELRVPFTVMGGITAERIEAVVHAGADILAVITAVTKSDSPEAAARELIRRIRAARETRPSALVEA